MVPPCSWSRIADIGRMVSVCLYNDSPCMYKVILGVLYCFIHWTFDFICILANERFYLFSGNSVILGVNCDGIMLIKTDDKLVLYEFRYHEVESIFLDPSDSFITINLMRQGDLNSHRCFVFETPQKTEIGSLIVSYCPSLSNWITENEVPVSSTHVTIIMLHYLMA